MASGFLAPVARRWKTQLNENGKTTAAFEELPEATHNTVVGFEQPDSLRDHLFVVFLAQPARPPPQRPACLPHRRPAGQGGRLSPGRRRPPGTGASGRRSRRLILGDFVSVYLAFAYGVDPSPVAVIDHIKERMAEADREGTA